MEKNESVKIQEGQGKTVKISFFILSYIFFTISLSFFGALSITLRGESPFSYFFHTVLGTLDELYLLTPESGEIFFISFIFFFFVTTYLIYWVRESAKGRQFFSFKTLFFFGIVLPFAAALALHLLNIPG